MKTGHWIEEIINCYTKKVYCSECSSFAPLIYTIDDFFGDHAHGEILKTKFCPNCGAKMEDYDDKTNQ